MKKKIVISHTCKECPYYKWREESGEVGWCGLKLENDHSKGETKDYKLIT